MVDKNQSALKRPRAPTITVDTSAVSEQHDPELSSPSAAFSGDPNTLAVPPARKRGDSVDSSTSAGTTSTKTYVDAPSPSVHQGSPRASFTSMADEDPLSPDPGTQDTFKVENNPFAFSPGQLAKLLDPKSFAAFQALGGLHGLEKGLRTNVHSGLSVEEDKLDGTISFEEAKTAATSSSPDSTVKEPPRITHSDLELTASGAPKSTFPDRKRVFGDNRLPVKKSKSILQLAWIALQDKVLILLSIAAVISLALGLYQTFGVKHDKDTGAKVEWVEGVAIMVAITIVVMVGAVNDWQKERQFVKLNQKKEDREVKVIRSGKTMKASVYDVFVGDVMILEQGDVLPVDGIFISGHNVTCDESSATGESDLLKKTPADDAFRAIQDGQPTKKLDPFILSGAKVSEGVGTFLVTGVGVNSSYGKTLMALREDNDITPLQFKLNVLAGYIAKLGSAAGLLLFVVLFIQFLARLPRNQSTPPDKANQFLQILIIAITIIVVAVPEGLPLAVTLALAFATKRMTKDNNLVRHLQSCETMGNATVICSDKTGTLTQNVMTVVSGTLGPGALRFGDQPSTPAAPRTAPQETADSPSSQETAVSRDSVSSLETPVLVSMADLSSKLSPELRDMLKQSIAVNTTAFEGEENGKAAFIGSKTETALLDWATARLGLDSLSIEKANFPLQQLFPFDSSRKCMGAVITLGENKYRMFFKGAPEILLRQCTAIVENPAQKLAHIPLTQSHVTELKHIVSSYAQRSLRTIAFVYRDFDAWPPTKASRRADAPDEAEFTDVFKELNWLGVVGIQDPVRPGVAEAVKDCQRASVQVKMVTGDNVETATAIAKECGILTEGGLVMEGPDFRRLSQFEMEAKVLDLCVLARSSPEDKKTLVKCLKGLNQVVAVTGDGTNDAPALKAADVGFSMGIAGTEVAKEASDIILMDDNFSSIVKALAWGRTINDAVKKFLQFQITVNITAVVLTFVTAVASSKQTAVLNAVQLLWVNLIMDTFAALALATDPPSGSLLERKPEPKSSALINFSMWKMIIGQSIFQLVVTFVLFFAGPGFLNYPARQQTTLVFNVFVWMQIFNAINSRRIDSSKNIFEGLHKNYLFIGIMLIMIGGQTLIVFVGGAAFVVTKLNGPQWGISIVLGILSIPVGFLIRCIPDSFIRRMIAKIIPDKLQKLRRKKVTVNSPDEGRDINTALLDIKDDLAFLKRIRGGRVNSMKFKLKHPKEILQRSRSGSRLSNSPMHSALGMPGLLAGSIVGLSPVDNHKNNTWKDGNGAREHADTLSPATATSRPPTAPRRQVSSDDMV